MIPSNIGGVNWGGVAYDGASDTLVTATNRIASVVTLIPRAVGVELSTGRIRWTRPLGTAEGLPLGPVDGMLNLGGSIATAAGLTFIVGAPDVYLRAFETASGRELWRGKLPAGARATPMTYADREGRQYVAISATGDGELFGGSDEILAFALPVDPHR